MTGQVIVNQALPMARTGEDELETAVREHARLVYRISYSVLRNHHDAEDATQETFLRVLRYRRTFADVREPRTWLARIAWRTAVERKRKFADAAWDDLGESVAQVRSLATTADEIVLGTEMSTVLSKAIATLPAKLRDPLTLSTLQKFPHATSPACWEQTRQQCAHACSALARYCVKSLQPCWEEIMEPDHRKRLIDQLLDDKWLDTALKQCSAAEPRPGLEDRVLASIRTECEKMTTPASSWWPSLAIAAAMLLIGTAAFLMRNQRAVTPAPIANHIPVTHEETGQTSKSPRRPRLRHTPRIVAQAPRSGSGEAIATPLLDQFPSPLPLSEQEKILANYVEQFRPQASLEARVQTELLRQELIERQELSPKDATSQNSQEQNP